MDGKWFFSVIMCFISFCYIYDRFKGRKINKYSKRTQVVTSLFQHWNNDIYKIVIYLLNNYDKGIIRSILEDYID